MTPRHLDLVLARPELAELDPAQRRVAIRALVRDAGIADGAGVAAELADYVDGFGLLTRLMDDPGVTDILVNGPFEVWVERAGVLERTDIAFSDAAELETFARRLLAKSGRAVDIARPIADAQLSGGSRIHVVLPPIAARGPVVSIRRFPSRAMDLDDLLRAGMTDADAHGALTTVVEERKNVVIAGGTGAGKTTLLNAMLMQAPRSERIVTIEETPELRLSHAHWVSLLARQANVERAGEIDLAELLRAALRMRPDRLVVGEVRGPESLVALSALATGHEGSMVTVHARSPSEVAARLVWLALQADAAPSQRALEEQVRHAFDVVVFVSRIDGRRTVTAIHPMT